MFELMPQKILKDNKLFHLLNLPFCDVAAVWKAFLRPKLSENRKRKENFTDDQLQRNSVKLYEKCPMSPLNKRFRIENLESFNGQEAAFENSDGVSGENVKMILTEIRELRDLVRPAGKVTIDIVDAYRREISEVLKLRTDLQDIERAINDTRKEMASLHVGAPSTVGMDQLSGELGAVVSQTEAAANTILGSAELIGDELSALQKNLTSGLTYDANISNIETEISKLYEACHFQDLTGQRIARVSETLAFIERQISRLTNIWGGLAAIDHLLAAEALAKAEEEETIGDHALANGPQLVIEDIGHVNQLEIDSLFN